MVWIALLLCLSVLQSSLAGPGQNDTEPPPILRNCSASEEQEFRRAFEQECIDTFDNATDFTNFATFLLRPVDPIHYVRLCSEPCLPSVLEHVRGCYGVNDGLAALYEGACLFNQDGTMCYTATFNSLGMSSWQTDARAECYNNFTQFVTPVLTETCSNECASALRQVRDELGCCLNAIYNNSFVGEHLPFADYSLWSNCGLESPGFCAQPPASAGAKSAGVYGLFMTIALGSVFLLNV